MDVGEVSGLRAITVYYGDFTVRDIVGELGDHIRVLTFVALDTSTVSRVNPDVSETCHRVNLMTSPRKSETILMDTDVIFVSLTLQPHHTINLHT